MTGLDELNWTELPRHNRRESPIGRNWPSQWSIVGQNLPKVLTRNQSGCEEMSRGRGVFIGDTSQSASGWWQPVCRSAWLRTHARRHLVLHMAGCMSRTHAGRHHSSQMSGCMTGAHARRHTSSHMSISMLQLHGSRHLVLGRSTSCSTWLAACPGHMQDATTPPRCQAA
ncbi:hypothetical protein YC2023_071688 [Brassica napus]